MAGLPNKLGKYELLMPLAAGGMARIYIGRSTGIGSFERHVVLKLITPERAQDQVAVQMFLDEARLAASLNHQNVAQVFEVGEDGGIHYLAMEYVHGQDLRALLAKAGSQGTRIPLELALTIVAGAAAGLNHAHERRSADGTPMGIVHRDVSPSNIMIGYDGSVKLLDFGIAKAAARSVETQSGIIKGKFAYMAPEQCRGRDVDRRSDVFSLGIILYEVSTQHRCFRADSDFDTMHRIVTGDVVRPTRLVQGYPQALEAIVMKALAVDAAQRYQSAGLLLEALEAFAIASRYSLSTMGLGRFMRDMFGEIQEPWLGNPQATNPTAPKETTISSTDGRSDVAPSPVLPDKERAATASDSVPRDDEARFPDSGGVAAATISNVPNTPSADPDDILPTTVQRPTPNPARISSSTLTPVPARQSAQQQAAQLVTGPHVPLTPLPMTGPQVPPGAFSQTPGSGSHSNASNPAIAALQSGPQPAIATTRHGYASGGAMTAPGVGAAANDLSYPRYEPDDVDLETTLKPNRRMLFIGVGIAIVGLIAIIAMAGGGSSKPKDNDGIQVGSDQGSAEVTAPTEMKSTAPDPKPADPKPEPKAETPKPDPVKTEPVKAEPVKTEAPPPEPVKTEPKKVVNPPPKQVTPVKTTPKTQPKAQPEKHNEAPAKPKCQPQGQVNPFDTSCGGHACPVCS
ncbi:MAG: protein kinase [Kofleriaceae bacterium]